MCFALLSNSRYVFLGGKGVQEYAKHNVFKLPDNYCNSNLESSVRNGYMYLGSIDINNIFWKHL